jgi:hypothetical protein
LTPTDLLDSLKAHKPAILAALACPAADLVQAHLDYVQDLAVFAEERRQSDDAAAELARLSANRQQADAARTTPEFAAGSGRSRGGALRR